MSITYTGVGFMSPDSKTQYCGMGIPADIYIKNMISNYIEGNDALIRKALELILKQ